MPSRVSSVGLGHGSGGGGGARCQLALVVVAILTILVTTTVTVAVASAAIVDDPEPQLVVTATAENEAVIREAVAWYSRALEATRAGDREMAIGLYRRAIDVYPQLAAAYNNLGMLLFEPQRGHETATTALAVLAAGAAAARETNDTRTWVSVHNNMGFVVREGRRQSIATCRAAIAYYDEALAVAPEAIDPLYNKASALYAMRRLDDAQRLYERVLAATGYHEGAHIDLGSIHFARGEIAAAVVHQDRVLAAPQTTPAMRLGVLHNKGHFLKESGQWAEALAVHEAALALAPDEPLVLADLITARRTLCVWADADALLDRLLARLDTELATRPRGVSLLPYDATLVPVSDRFRRRLAVAHTSLHTESATLSLLPPVPLVTTDAATADRHRPRRPLRVGYLSFDFRDHPMGHLTLGLLDAHAPDRVETFCYSYGPDDGSEWRRRAERQCRTFRELRALSDWDAAQAIAGDRLDVVIDLMAHTKGSRLGITALRPAPIVVNYLGYPGTMGSAFTDVALIDRGVVPPEHAAASLTERVVYLPRVYQVNEYDWAVPACGGDEPACLHTNRSALGLPGDPAVVVYCNFNTIDKMEPVSFGVWLNILRRVPRGVLWLLAPARPHAERIQQTLRDEASARGVDPRRLHFAERLPKRQHLARITHADVFLDSFVYNAHSTAADALWAHVPLVSCWGSAFPSRVAGSLLQNAIDLPELIPHSLREFEDLAVRLGEDPGLRRRLRRALARQGPVSPLFDTPRSAAAIESAYEALVDLQNARQASSRMQLVLHPFTSFGQVDDRQRRVQEATARAMAQQERGHVWEAIHIYRRVLRVDPIHRDALHLLGVAWHQLGHPDRAQRQLDRAVEVYPEFVLLRFHRAMFRVSIEDIDGAIADLEATLALDPLHTAAFEKLTEVLYHSKQWTRLLTTFETTGAVYLDDHGDDRAIPDSARQRAFLLYSYALNQVGKAHEAISILNAALLQYPRFFRAGYNLAVLLSARGEVESSDRLQITMALEEATYEHSTSGMAVIKHPRPIGRPVVAIYCNEYGQSWWGAWGPSSLHRGLGGSEEAVVFMARELARLGFWVEVYANPPGEDIGNDPAVPGIQWYPQSAYDPTDSSVDVFIAWRYHISLGIGATSRVRLLWIHDVPTESTKRSPILEEIDGILCVSEFQASLFPGALREKIFVTSNALDPGYFVDLAPGIANRPTEFVYGSAPNRGLEHLLRAWPRLRQELPMARLTVYYGFTPAFVAWGQQHMANFEAWRREMDQLLRQEGVSYVGLVDHGALAEGYARAGFYLYPTTFSETSCVSVMKAMALGAIPITSRLPNSALSETCGEFDLGPEPLRYEGGAPDPEWTAMWLAGIVKAVREVNETAKLRSDMITFARTNYRWSNVAKRWAKHFTTLLALAQ